MDNTRLFLWLALAAMLWLNYDAWVRDRAPQPPAAAATTESRAAPEDDALLPNLPSDGGARGGAELPTASDATPERTITVRTDVLDVAIDTRGGDLVRADLLEYPVEKDRPDEIVRLLDYTPSNRWVLQSGLVDAAGGDAPNHVATFSSERSSYELAPGQDELVVTLEWVGGGDLKARKIYTFRRGRYAVDLDIVIENATGEPWRGAPYAQMQRVHNPVERSYTSVSTYSFTGPVLFDGESADKLDVEDLLRKPITRAATGGWLAGIQHHFLAAIVPPENEPFELEATARDNRYLLRALGPIRGVAPRSQETFSFTFFVGPKLQDQLRETANKLVLTVDYGMLTPLAQPLFWVLSWVHKLVGNWGWSIVIVTLLIKAVFYKLTETSGRSMAKMRKVAPRLKALQERYKDDPAKLRTAMMELYRTEKINPAAGCLPLLVQMPFFFAFYWVLIESVEMRQAPFMLWIDDLSSRDPFFVLPLLMGAAMLFQTRINPAPPDPVQARVMQIMPIVFTVFFALFPAGLVLYWLTNTLVSIVQQWHINKVVGK
ncbi:MAG: membrane protein insertase YidC [Gammaproteobacteria bacterium]